MRRQLFLDLPMHIIYPDVDQRDAGSRIVRRPSWRRWWWLMEKDDASASAGSWVLPYRANSDVLHLFDDSASNAHRSSNKARYHCAAPPFGLHPASFCLNFHRSCQTSAQSIETWTSNLNPNALSMFWTVASFVCEIMCESSVGVTS